MLYCFSQFDLLIRRNLHVDRDNGVEPRPAGWACYCIEATGYEKYFVYLTLAKLKQRSDVQQVTSQFLF